MRQRLVSELQREPGRDYRTLGLLGRQRQALDSRLQTSQETEPGPQTWAQPEPRKQELVHQRLEPELQKEL